MVFLIVVLGLPKEVQFLFKRCYLSELLIFLNVFEYVQHSIVSIVGPIINFSLYTSVVCVSSVHLSFHTRYVILSP